MPIDALKPYEKNARHHDTADVEAIKNSINEFSFSDPIGIWGPENIIVEGHGRLQAAKELGMTEVPIIRLDHLTDEQRRAYALAHNKTAELSSWDLELQGLELADITDIDMSLFGFDKQGDIVPTREEIEEGEVVDNSRKPVCVKVVFRDADNWRHWETSLRELVDTLDGASVSVGAYEDQ